MKRQYSNQFPRKQDLPEYNNKEKLIILVNSFGSKLKELVNESIKKDRNEK